MLVAGDGRDGFGQLGEAAARHGLAAPTWAPLHRHAVDDSKSFFVLDREACILCGRCTTACDDVQRIGAISLVGRGHAERVGVFGDGLMASSICTSCGQCVATCPTGALRPKEAPARIERRVETTCPYCGVGCGIVNAVRDDGRLAVMADDVPANRSERGHALREGPVRDGLPPREGPRRPPDGPAGRPLGAGLLGRGPRRRGGRARAPPRALRGARLRQGDQRGRLPHPEALPRGDEHEQRGSLHAPLPLALGRGDAHVDGLRRHLELVRRLRGGRLPHDRGGGREREPPRDRDPLPPRPRAGGADRRGQSEADRALRLRPRLDPPAPGDRRRPLQRDGAGHPDRRPLGRGVRAGPHRGVRRLAGRGGALHAGARRGDHRRAGRRHRAGGPLVRAAALRRILPHLGHGHHPAHERDRERPRAPEPGARRRPARKAGERHLAAPRPEQRPGLRRRGVHPDEPPGLPELRRTRRSRSSSAPGASGRRPSPASS